MAEKTYGSAMAKNSYGSPMAKNIYGPPIAQISQLDRGDKQKILENPGNNKSNA